MGEPETVWVITRYPHGVRLNPVEYVLGKDNKVLLFDTAGDALNHYLEHGGDVEDINHGVQICEEIKDDVL